MITWLNTTAAFRKLMRFQNSSASIRIRSHPRPSRGSQLVLGGHRYVGQLVELLSAGDREVGGFIALRDRDLLELLLPSPVRYLGLLGPRRRTDQLLDDLREKGTKPAAEQLGRLYAPVGLLQAPQRELVYVLSQRASQGGAADEASGSASGAGAAGDASGEKIGKPDGT